MAKNALVHLVSLDYNILDALASLVLMIETDSLTDWLTRRLEINSPSDRSELINSIEIDTEWTA